MSGTMTGFNLDVPIDLPTSAPQELAPMPGAARAGAQTDQAIAGLVTAQRVAIKRNTPDILRRINEAAALLNTEAYYQWDVNKKGGGKETIEGPTIKAAMAVASIYGNCKLGARVVDETATHWHLEGVFVDLETGFTFSRPFQQRKQQNIGMKDSDRASDLVFQIAASKAIRNAVVGALSMYVDRLVEAARQGIVNAIGKNPDLYRERIVEKAQEYGVPLDRIIRKAGRAVKDWRAQDMAVIIAQMRSVSDGMATIDDVWPPDQQDDPGLASDQGGSIPTGKPVETKPAEAKPEADTGPTAAKQAKRKTDEAAPTKPPADDAAAGGDSGGQADLLSGQ